MLERLENSKKACGWGGARLFPNLGEGPKELSLQVNWVVHTSTRMMGAKGGKEIRQTFPREAEALHCEDAGFNDAICAM